MPCSLCRGSGHNARTCTTPRTTEVHRRYADRMEHIYTLTEGGELRAARGNLVEDLVQDCCNLLGLEARTGTKDKQTLTVGPHSKEHQVDRHVYRNGVPVLFIECKAYLDSCYYVRACDDFTLMKLRHPNVPCIVVALENSMADDSKAFTDATHEGACSQVFYLCAGKRSSTRPLYHREHQKPIAVDALLAYLQSVAG